jgi:sialate O-acetylesterase
MHTSAVGYFFARDVHNKLGVPVGLIHTSWGGTPAQAWTSLEGLEASSELKPLADSFTSTRDHLAAAKEKFEKETVPNWKKEKAAWDERYGSQLKEWQAAVKEAKDAGKPAPPRPSSIPGQPHTPQAPDNNPNVPTVLYNGMIAPILHYAIEGVIWYQGESNAGNPKQYQTLFPAMIEDWRKHWSAINPDEKDFPFCFVQLANFMAREKDPTQSEGGWPGLREAQHMTLAKLPNTGEAVIIDIGQANDIHPKDKMDVGHRLALAAFKIAYGQQDVVFSGPTFQSMSVDGDRIRLKFANVGAGLTIASAPSTQPGVPQEQPASEVKGFSIAGDDHHFVWAQAKIEGPDTIAVWSDEVPHPAAVRYAWANNPECNLYNKEGLPASPFRTDTWTTSAPKR